MDHTRSWISLLLEMKCGYERLEKQKEITYGAGDVNLNETMVGGYSYGKVNWISGSGGYVRER